MDIVRYKKDTNTNSIIGFDADGKGYLMEFLGIPLSSDSSDVEAMAAEITDIKNELKTIPNDISRTQTDATFVYKEGSSLTSLFYLRQATSSLAGLMTASQCSKLDSMPSASDVQSAITQVGKIVEALNNANISIPT